MASVRSRLALEALAELSHGSEWITADAVASRANTNANLTAADDSYFEAVGVGRMLANAARAGRCEVEFWGYYNAYKSIPEG